MGGPTWRTRFEHGRLSLDGRESPLQQGSGVVDEQYYLDLIANQSQAEERTFVEALAAGDLDAVGLVFAVLLPIVGIGTTLAFRVKMRCIHS